MPQVSILKAVFPHLLPHYLACSPFSFKPAQPAVKRTLGAELEALMLSAQDLCNDCITGGVGAQKTGKPAMLEILAKSSSPNQ
jgi:hypothetical protein